MTSSPPIVAICPTCGHKVEVACLTDSTGVLHPAELDTQTLVQHSNCDLWELLKVLSSAAYHLSKVQVFNVKGDSDVR